MLHTEIPWLTTEPTLEQRLAESRRRRRRRALFEGSEHRRPGPPREPDPFYVGQHRAEDDAR